MNYDNALLLATKYRERQTYKEEKPFINHSIAVASMLNDQGYPLEYQIAGLLHDLLGNTDCTEEEILECSNNEVLKAVKLLSSTTCNNTGHYVEEILKNPIAKAVKNCDRILHLRDLESEKIGFRKVYLYQTKRFYLREFSEALDEEYYRAVKLYEDETDSYAYVTDASIDNGPLYKRGRLSRLSYVYQDNSWVICDQLVMADLGDNTLWLSSQEAAELIAKINSN